MVGRSEDSDTLQARPRARADRREAPSRCAVPVLAQRRPVWENQGGRTSEEPSVVPRDDGSPRATQPTPRRRRTREAGTEPTARVPSSRGIRRASSTGSASFPLHERDRPRTRPITSSYNASEPAGHLLATRPASHGRAAPSLRVTCDGPKKRSNSSPQGAGGHGARGAPDGDALARSPASMRSVICLGPLLQGEREVERASLP